MLNRLLKFWVLLIICFQFLLPVSSQSLQVYRSQPDARLASEMLYEYLTAIAHEKLIERQKRISSIQTVQQIAQRQEEIRLRIHSMLGPLPDKTPLEAQITGSFDRDDYRVEKIVYQSRPHYYVTANLYIPTGKGDGPFPAILGPCGHSLTGKAAAVYQKVYSGLATLGCVVLVYDQPGQGERFMYYNEKLGESTFHPEWPSTVEHTMAGIQCLLAGSNAATYFIWDAIRGIDYLLSRPEVDSTRIGITGNSGGGTLSAYTSALDNRIEVAVPSCYITSWRMLWDTIGPQDAEQNLLPFIANGLDFSDFAIAFAPKPYLINAAIQDFFPIRGTRASFEEARRVYKVAGAKDNIQLFEANDGHGYTKPRRESAYSWFGKHFLNLSGPVEEREMRPELDQTLQVTSSGQVVTDYPDAESMSSLNAAFAQARKPKLPPLENRQEIQEFRDSLLKGIRELLQYNGDLEAPLNLQNRGNGSFEGIDLDYVTYDSEPGITIPALFFKPADPSSGWKTPVLYASDRSMADDAGTDIEALVEAGHPVLAPDVRGKGETARANEDDGSFANWFSDDYRVAMMALQLNRPLVGMRMLDLTRGVSVLEKLCGKSQTGCIAVGKGSGTIPLLHTAALDQRITTIVLENGLISWMNMVQNTYHRQQLDNVVQGALEVYDLPFLAAVIAPRMLVLGNTVNGVGHLAEKDKVAMEYSSAKHCYALLGHPGQLRVIERQPGISIMEAYF